MRSASRLIIFESLQVRRSSGFFLGVEGVDLLEFLVFVQHPVVVNIWFIVFRNFNDRVFVIELLLGLQFIKDWQVRWFLISFVFIVICTCFFTIILLSDPLLVFFPLIVGFNIVSISVVEFLFLVSQELHASSLSGFLLLLPLSLDLPIVLMNGFPSYDV